MLLATETATAALLIDERGRALTLPDGSRAAEVVRVPFHGTEIHTVLVGGEPHIVLRPTLDAMGLNYSAQFKKLQTRSWATVSQTETVAEDGKPRAMVTVNLDTWSMLLANINEERVAPTMKETIVAYQRESARVLRNYWTAGGALNPRANADQLDDLTERIEQRKADLRAEAARRDLSVIRELEGIVDPRWRESLGRHAWAIYKGEATEIAAEDRLLMVQPYLVERGVSKADIASIGSVFGKRVKAAYVAEYNREPEEVPALLNGRERPVKGYYERDRFLFDAVFDEHYSHLVGLQQLMLGGAA
jgi:hypothetical protein